MRCNCGKNRPDLFHFPIEAPFILHLPLQGEAGMGRYAATRLYPHPHPTPPLEEEGIVVVSNAKWNYTPEDSLIRQKTLN